MNTCDCCGRKQDHLTRVDTSDFHGWFCPVCCSMMEQTTRDDGTSRLHPSHKKQVLERVNFNQACKNAAVQVTMIDHVIIGKDSNV